MLNKFVDTITITKRILDLEINLTFGKLLLSVSATKKQLIKTITKDKAIQFWAQALESDIVYT